MAGPVNIAVIANQEGQETRALLSRAAAGWKEAGLHVVGVLAEDHDTDEPCSAGFLRDIATGRRYPVRLDAPPVGTTCHLDAAGMSDAGAELLAQIASADIVVLSKFGKLETMRQGLWAAFAAAVASARPLLTTVSPKHVEAWAAFAPAAAWLDADGPSIERWWQAQHTGPGRPD